MIISSDWTLVHISPRLLLSMNYIQDTVLFLIRADEIVILGLLGSSRETERSYREETRFPTYHIVKFRIVGDVVLILLQLQRENKENKNGNSTKLIERWTCFLCV